MNSVLLIMPLSYGYNNIITNALVKKGFTVKFIPDFDESVTKRFFRKFLSIGWWQYYYVRKQVEPIKRLEPDLILLIRGYNFNYRTIKYLKDTFPKSKRVLYQWDPLSISRFEEKGLCFFDKIYSFDIGDCMRYKLNHLPLFYKSKNNSNKIETIYDFSFIGTAHSQRLAILGSLIKELKSKAYSYYIAVYVNRYEYIKGCVLNRPGYRNFPMENLSFKPINKSFSEQIVRQSKVILDVNHPEQTGLSIRVIESLGEGKKVITTNKAILKESFFDQEVIGIILDGGLPSNIDMLLSNEKHANVEMYEIDNWIDNFVNS